MQLDKFKPSIPEIIVKAFELANIKRGERFIDLGSGDGCLVVEAIRRGAKAIGYEIRKDLAEYSKKIYGINVINDDCFNADVFDMDIVMFYQTLLPETELLMDKLYKEMKIGSKLITITHIKHLWKPKLIVKVNRQNVCLFLKE